MRAEVAAAYARGTADAVRAIQVRNEQAIASAADVVVQMARTGRVLHAAGAGHSLAGVLEMFYRAGGLAFVNPLWHPEILPLTSADGSTSAERRVGLGESVARGAGIAAGDAVVVFSNSGVNAYPIEIAREARSVGATVIAVTSPRASQAAPLRAGARLFELADIVLDTLVPPGDVTWPAGAVQVAPLSSLANVLCWNLVMVAALEAEPHLPTWRSANASTGDPNAELMQRYAPVIGALAG
ncbi:MAG: sugar isomerase domain-containing protein [Propioniciclava sp.]